MSDEELLRAYATESSEAAFSELVRRHAGAVQAAALRQTGNAHLAEEVTLAVFLQLARKASSLKSSSVLLGWLLRAVRYAAIDAVRAEARRQKREAVFLAMQPLESTQPNSESDSLWNRVAPLLDEALLRLREGDRNVLLLRFFENKPLAAVGSALGVPEDTARKRVQRALERLEAQLLKRGALASASVLPGLLTARVAPTTKAEMLSAAVRSALTQPDLPGPSVLGLSASLGRRLLWSASRPWLAAAGILAAAVGTTMVGSQEHNAAVEFANLPDDDYRLAGFPEAAVVRTFVAQLQNRLGANARREVVGMIHFPLRVIALNLP